MINKDVRHKIYGYITRSLGMRDYVRGWVKGNCPSCGREDKYGVNIGRNRTNCFVCGYNPSPIKLIAELEGLDEYKDVLSFLGTYKGRAYIEPIVKRVEKLDVKLPAGYTNILFGKGLIAEQARKYIKGRGFDLDEAAYKGWGYCTTGVYLGYIILPFYLGGKLIYFNARRYMGSGPKYNNPTIDEFGIGKSLIIYNLDALSVYEEVFLAEGVFNAETIGGEGIASGGKKISHYQISAIIKSPVKRITMLLDPDAIVDSIKLGLDMAYHKLVRIVTWAGTMDVNDIGRKETMKRVRATPWQTYNDLLKMKHSLR